MRKIMAVPAVAAVLALSGCGGEQSLIGQGALDPEAPQLTAEEAVAESQRMREAAGLQEGGSGESGTESHGSGTGSDHSSTESEDHVGESDNENQPDGQGIESGLEPGARTDSATSGGGATGAGGTTGSGQAAGAGSTGLTEQAFAQFEQQFPEVASAVGEQQLGSTATQVCTAIESGGASAAQVVVQNLPGVEGTTVAQQVVGFFDREVCTS